MVSGAEPAAGPGLGVAEGADPAGTAPSGRSARWAAYVHVPFCAHRCGYCDFNTYVPAELPDGRSSVRAYPADVVRELDLLRDELPPRGPLESVYLGGGTPTMLTPAELGLVVTALEERWGLVPGAEVTTEANPDTVDEQVLIGLAEHGFTRISLGMQSSVRSVLATLGRTHEQANVARAVRGARAAGLQVSLDLIYGTPGESLSDWRRSVERAVELEPDHVSAYALTVEPGTAMGQAVRRGRLPMPDDDDEADKYELVDELLEQVGYSWYEISSWARSEATRSRHNLAYWTGGEWLAAGPGGHGYVDGSRWQVEKLPRTWSARLAAGELPWAGREEVSDEQRYEEQVLLGIRVVDGLPLEVLRPEGREAVAGLIASGIVDGPAVLAEQRVRLTRRGRLLADTAVRALLAF